jgi:hypothetical protein
MRVTQSTQARMPDLSSTQASSRMPVARDPMLAPLTQALIRSW